MENEGFLLDTNVISETRKSRPFPPLLSMLAAWKRESLFASVLTFGELRRGVVQLRESDQASGGRLEKWVDGIEEGFQDRILSLDLETAWLWGAMSADRPRPPIDTLLAASAVRHGLVFVTRNVKDVRELKNLTIINPWDQS